MVRCSAAYHGLEAVLSRYPAQECPELRLNLFSDQIAAILRGEYTMNQAGNIGMRHWTAPRGSGVSPGRDSHVGKLTRR
jgi:hypothetical protein